MFIATLLFIIPSAQAKTAADLLNASQGIRAGLENPAALSGPTCAATLDAFTATVESYTSKDFKRRELAKDAHAIAGNFGMPASPFANA